MNSKIFSGLLTVGFLVLSLPLSGCFSKKSDEPKKESFDSFKSSEAKEACVSSNLSQWEFSGPFVSRLLLCASRQNENGESTMPAIRGLLTSLDERKLQLLIDFLMTVDPEGKTHEEQYPYLLAVTSLADRGLLGSSIHDRNLSNERLDVLQPFLLEFDSQRSRELLSLWSRNGRLAEILNEMGRFLNHLENDTVEGWARELLVGETFKSDLLPWARTILSKEAVLSLAEKSMRAQAAQSLSSEDRARIRENYREPLSPDDKGAEAVFPASPAAIDSPVQRLVNFKKQWTTDEQESIVNFAVGSWENYRTLPAKERASLNNHIVPAVESFLDQQTAPIHWALSVASDARNIQASDLGKINKALDQLLLDGGNIALEAIRAKAGASRLIEDLRNLLVDGGPVPGCPAVQIQLNAADYSSVARELGRLSRPQAACGGQAPLFLAIQSLTHTTIQKDCPPDASNCIGEREAQNLLDYWAEDFVEPQADLLKDLLRKTLQEVEKRLEVDPYYLYDLGFAKASVSKNAFGSLREFINEQNDWSLEGLARLDQELNGKAELQKWLLPDFLEGLLAEKLERLSSLSHQFADLSEGDDQHSTRVFAGVYTDGPMEELIRRKLSDPELLDNLPFAEDAADLKAYFQSHRTTWNQLLARAKQADGFFRYPEFGTLNDESKLVFSNFGASLRNYQSFDENLQKTLVVNATHRHRIIQPLQTFRVFADDDQGLMAWSLWRQHYLNGPTHAKDIPAPLSGKLQAWLEGSFVPTLSSDETWPELIGDTQLDGAIDSSFFDVENYSPAEARLLAFYYLRSQRKFSPGMPTADLKQGKSSSPKTDLTSFADPIRGFMNASYLLREDSKSDFGTFAKYFPEVFQAEPQETLSSFKERVLPDYQTTLAGLANWTFAEQAQVNELSKLPFDRRSPFALLSTLNLLTYAKPQTKFIPQSLVGFGDKLCRSKVKNSDGTFVETTGACPLEFSGHSEAEAYARFRDYLSSEAAQLACAFINNDSLGDRNVWQTRLGIRLDKADLCLNSVQTVDADLVAPNWLGRRVLADIFAMGKQARLKRGLAQVPSALRFYKLKSNPGDGLVEDWLLQSKGVWEKRAAAAQRRREFFAGGFWSGQPSLLSSYLTAAGQAVDSYAWRNNLIAYSESDAQGQRQDYLRDVIRLFRSEQSRVAEESGDFHRLAFHFYRKLAAMPDHLRFLSHAIGSFETLETYDFLSTELPLATELLFPREGDDANPFDWNDRGLNFARYFGQTANLRSWARATRFLKDDDLNTLLAQLDRNLQKLSGTIDEQAALFKKLQGQFDEFAHLWLAESALSLADLWEQIAGAWRHESYGRAVSVSWLNFVNQVEKPLFNWDGQATTSANASIAAMIRAAILDGPELIKTVQDAGSMQEDLFWTHWADAILRVIDKEPQGSEAMANFLAEPRFDFRAGLIWDRAMKPGLEQDRLVAAVGAIESVPIDLWRAALLEGTDIFGRLERSLNYLSERIVWKVDPEHNAFRIALAQIRQLSADSELRLKQTEVLRLWFRPGDESADTVVTK